MRSQSMAKKASLEAIKALREKTSASLNDVRAALESSGGNEAKALEWLRQRGAQIAHLRQGRATAQGRIESYIHHDGRMGALVEVNCETDFVSRTPEFVQLCRDLALHVAAMSPRYLQVEDVPASQDLSGDVRNALCLLEQPFVKDPGTTIQDLLKAFIAKTGENIVVRRFIKFTVGEAVSS